MIKDGAEMEYSSTHDLILDLKRSREDQGLSIQQVKEMVEDLGFYPSMTTLRRVFKECSENDSFNYESTLRPLMRALLKNDSPDNKVALYEDALAYKAQEIESLHKQIESLKAAREKDLEQIKTKDRRMDEQAKRTDKLIDQLGALNEKLVELTGKLLEMM